MRASVLAVTLASIVSFAPPAHAQCTQGWDTTLGNPSGKITASLSYDDGTGPALYVGYSGKSFAGKVLGGVAKLEGQQWVALDNGIREDRWAGSRYWPVHDSNDPLGDAMVPIVHDMVEFDPDGAGPQRPVMVVAVPLALNEAYVPTIAVSSWNGTQWSSMGNGLLHEVPLSYKAPVVNALAVFDSGSGPQLYATGEFAVANEAGEQFYGVAVWDGVKWQPVGDRGFNPPLNANSLEDGRDLLVHDDGSGPALYVTGAFSGITLTPGTANIARWNGTAWSSVGGGRPAGASQLVAFDDDGQGGAGPKLYTFNYLGLASWSGAAWDQHGQIPLINGGSAAAVLDDGTGPALYLGGSAVGQVDGSTRLIRYNGSTFSEVGDKLYGIWFAPPDTESIDPNNWTSGASINYLAVHTINGASRVIAGGDFTGSVATPVAGNLMWNGANWAPLLPLGGPAGDPSQKRFVTRPQFALQLGTVDLDGSGPQQQTVFAAGTFKTLEGHPTTGGVCVRNGSTWTTLIDHLPMADVVSPVEFSYAANNVFAVPMPSGDAVYCASSSIRVFPPPDSAQVGLYRLDGTTWTVVGAVSSDLGISRLFVADLGAGSRVYGYGTFGTSGGIKLGRLNGNAWEMLGTVPDVQAPYAVETVCVGNDGTGDAIYFGGRFVGDKVVKWNGTVWSGVSAGLPERSDPIGNYINPIPTLVTLNGSVYAWFAGVREYTFEFGPYVTEGVLYRLNNGVWTEVGTPTSGYVFTSIIGVANPGDGERLYFNYFTEDYENTPGWFGVRPFDTDHAGVVEFDGVSFTENPAFGRFVGSGYGGPANVLSVPEADGSTSLWFTSMSAVGATDPAELRGPLVGISSGGLARYVICPPACPADLDNGSGSGAPDGGVDINDLLFFLVQFEAGSAAADLDNGTFTGTPDGGVDINDLLFFLVHFEGGC